MKGTQIYPAGNIPVNKDGLLLGSKDKFSITEIIVQRFDAEMVPYQDQSLFIGVIKSKGEYTIQVL